MDPNIGSIDEDTLLCQEYTPFLRFLPHRSLWSIRATFLLSYTIPGHIRHVYAWEAVEDLWIKAKNWKDLMTDAPFERKDLIMIQDPLDDALNERRDISNFNYLK